MIGHPYNGLDATLAPFKSRIELPRTESDEWVERMFPGGTGTVVSVDGYGNVTLLLADGSHVKGSLDRLTLADPEQAVERLRAARLVEVKR